MQTNTEQDLELLSGDLLLAVKLDEATDEYVNKLSKLNESQLSENLKTNDQKTAFWLNIYNAYSNMILKKNPELYKDRNKFFKSKMINVAGKKLSLDDIEHGLLRRSKIKWSLGYMNKWFVNDFEKKHRVDKLDWRIHFSLNCGAKSCPPIAYYESKNLNQQLDLSTRNYLESECELDTQKNTVAVPALMSWFRKDFGGKKAIKGILVKYNILKENQNPSIKFKKYDWNLDVNNYSNT